MATGLGAAGANTALDELVATYPWIQLHVGDPGANGTANPADEATRKQATWGPAVNGATSNSAPLTWTNVAATEDYTHFSAWSDESDGDFGFSGTITANAVIAGDTITIAVGDLDVSFTLAS